jgi:RNA 3'-terminal phosphate cyclase (ATP)
MVRDLCDGQLDGAEIGSTEITFTPEKIKGGIHTADTKTAGYVPLTCPVKCGSRVRPGSKSRLSLTGLL